MIDPAHLQEALKQGVINAEQAEKLKALATPAPTIDTPSISPDDERFRILGGFNDIFVALGLLLLISALYGFAAHLGFFSSFAAVSLVISWILSEIFARRLKLALPSILLALMFTASAYIAFLFTLAFDFDTVESAFGKTFAPGFNWNSGGKEVALSFVVSFIAAGLHFYRFRVPINGAIMAASAVGFGLTAITASVDDAVIFENYNLFLLASGVLVFIAAMILDAKDRTRVTIKSDMAFWMHLLAAPLLVHPIIALSTIDVSSLNMLQAITVLGLFTALALLALVIDRRAILVSALAYAGFALGFVIENTASTTVNYPITLLILAGVVLSLSAGWRVLRKLIVTALPLGRLRNYIPAI